MLLLQFQLPANNNLVLLGVIVTCAIVALLTIGMILARLYQRASKEASFVRTGFGGQKVIMSGGAIVLPVLHETILVNMNTLRLEVRRANEQALITKDRMRVDVTTEFYVRCKPTVEAIADAAQTLGRRTMDPQKLKELIEAKFVDALRSVAAAMDMEELHEQRVEFVQRVQNVVSEDLLKNGLELEAVSLTSLNQTTQEFFNAQNAFDAQGLTKLTQEIESRRKQRNDIERDTEVLIQQKNLEAQRKQLEISREVEYAKLAQEQEIAFRRAAQVADVAREQATREQAAKQAQIDAKRQVDQAQILAERAVAEERIRMEQLLKEKDIEKIKAIETAEVLKQQTIQLAQQGSAIAIAEKSKAQSEVEAEASLARANAVKEAERVITVKETEIAERAKAIDLVEASREAQRMAIGVTVAAEAEKQAALDRAEALKTMAAAEAGQVLAAAEGEAEAEKLRAAAAEIRYAVDAAGRRSLNEAENLLSADIIAYKIKTALMQALPEIIRESVKPLEQIEGIKIIQVSGLNTGSTGGGEGNGTGKHDGGSLADQLVNSALRYRGQAPLVDSLLKEIGLEGASTDGLTQALRPVPPPGVIAPKTPATGA